MSNLDLMRKRLEYRGGEAQQDRMIKDKRKTLDHAVLYSYQGAKVRKPGSETVERALINRDKTKQDYDDKILSIGYEFGYAPGDIFEWVNTNTYWLIYLQDLTELAYFRGEIRKCRYEISWVNENGEKVTTYAAVKGPVETRINSITKSNNVIDIPNYSLSLLLPLNEDTLNKFTRYSRFFLKGVNTDEPICWRVEGTDSISTPGILELTAVEYYYNEQTDNPEEGLVEEDYIYVNDKEQEEIQNLISGEGFIKPKLTYEFSYKGNEKASWEIENIKYLPIDMKVSEDNVLSVTWLKNYTGKFTIKYGNTAREIIVESLFG